MAEELTTKEKMKISKHFRSQGYSTRFEKGKVIVFIEGTNFEKSFSEKATARLLK